MRITDDRIQIHSVDATNKCLFPWLNHMAYSLSCLPDNAALWSPLASILMISTPSSPTVAWGTLIDLVLSMETPSWPRFPDPNPYTWSPERPVPDWSQLLILDQRKLFIQICSNTQGSKKESKISYNFQKIFATTNTTIQLRSISVSPFSNICILNFILYPHYSLWSRISALGNNSHWRLRAAATNPTMVAFVPCKKSNSRSRLNDHVAGLAGLTSKIGFQVILRLSGFRFNSNYFALCNLHKKFYLIYLVHRVM